MTKNSVSIFGARAEILTEYLPNLRENPTERHDNNDSGLLIPSRDSKQVPIDRTGKRYRSVNPFNLKFMQTTMIIFSTYI
jgi:hypothetical protein